MQKFGQLIQTLAKITIYEDLILIIKDAISSLMRIMS